MAHLSLPLTTISRWVCHNNSHDTRHNKPLTPNAVYCMDCLDGLRRLPHESVDLVFADIMGISQGRVAQVIKNLLGANIFLKDRNVQILDLYLEGWTEAEIGRKVTLSRPRVTQILHDVKNGIDAQINIPDLPQIGES